MGMAAEVRMVLYEDDSVQVHYACGSTLQLSPCGSEFLFEKALPPSTHPLEQPERIRQRTHFVISNYREQLQRALDFRNSSATCPFLSESIIPPERKKAQGWYPLQRDMLSPHEAATNQENAPQTCPDHHGDFSSVDVRSLPGLNS